MADEQTKTILSSDQQKAVDHLTNWWKEGKSKDIILSGFPGTGKTFLAKYFTQSMKTAVPLFTAPTNEAVRQLEISTGQSCKTTYSALGLVLSTFSHKQKIVQKNLPKELSDYNLLLIDEASMAGKKAPDAKDSLLMDFVISSGMRRIWLGDWAQLPPTESTDGKSPVFEQGYEQIELTQVQRHSGPLLDFAMALREQITKPVKNLPKVPDGVECRNDSFSVKNMTDTEFQELISDQARFIVWTNQATKYNGLPGVNEFNAEARVRLFGRTLAESNFILPTDRILFASPLMDVKKESGSPFTSLEEASIEDFLGALPKLKFSILSSVNTRAEVISRTTTNILGVASWRVEFEVEGGVNQIGFVPTEEGEKQKAEIEKKLRHAAVNAGSGKEAGQCWNAYHCFRQCFAEVKHTYCITGHRSQGSTIPKVYVGVSNLLQNRDRLVAFKNLYVASTRAKNELILLRRR